MLGFEYGYSLDCPGGAGDLGGAVRRLRQRRAGHHRSVHRQRRGQVAAAVAASCCCCRTATKGRGPSTRARGSSASSSSAAEDNIQVVQPTTPAQNFHLLRRQVFGRLRKPLIVMTPKSLLRAQARGLDARRAGDRPLPARDPRRPAGRRRSRGVLLCTGKVYYELLEARERAKRDDVAIVRLEQLYPWPGEEIRGALGAYATARAWSGCRRSRTTWAPGPTWSAGPRSAVRPLPLEGIARRSGQPGHRIAPAIRWSSAAARGRVRRVDVGFSGRRNRESW